MKPTASRTHTRTAVKWLIGFALVVLILGGCSAGKDENSDGSSDGSTDPYSWPVSIYYAYEYDDDGNRIREFDDNNYNGVSPSYDVVWVYGFNLDGVRTGYDMYDSYADYRDDGDPAYIGVYDYDGDGFLMRLTQTSFDGGDQQVWDYTTNASGQITAYTFYDNGEVSETATYSFDGDGNVTRLRTSTGTWDYFLDDNGVRENYEYDQGNNGSIDRVGTYFYNSSGQLTRLESRSRPN